MENLKEQERLYNKTIHIYFKEKSTRKLNWIFD